MIKKVRFSIFFTCLLAVVLTAASVIWIFYGNFLIYAKSQLKSEAMTMATVMNDVGTDFLKESGKKSLTRITLIAPDGTVIYDNFAHPSTLGNHLERPEVTDALKFGEGQAVRQSQTLAAQTNYYALRLDNGDVLRLACTSSTVVGIILNRLPALACLVGFILVLAGLISKKLTAQIVNPILNLDLANPMDNQCCSEISPLLLRMEKQRKKIDLQIKAISRQQSQIEKISQNIQEGLVILDGGKSVLFLNKAAEKIFGNISPGANYLFINRDQEFTTVVERAFDGVASSAAIQMAGSDYEIYASPILDGDSCVGAMLFCMDITQKQKFEQMRREFSANVSHELKTPLTSILGYSELMKSGMAKQEDFPLFSDKIFNEATRLLTLIDDIMALSKLDENLFYDKFEDTDLFAVASDVVGTLKEKAAKQEVEISLQGDHAVLKAIPSILREMVFNLCDNAINYNRPNGFVKVTIAKSTDCITLCVKDSGIGIDPAHQERIFERFYRVDKSHSKSSGGTGLGLAIVKNGAAVHRGQVGVESVWGEGSTFFVRFKI